MGKHALLVVMLAFVSGCSTPVRVVDGDQPVSDSEVFFQEWSLAGWQSAGHCDEQGRVRIRRRRAALEAVSVLHQGQRLTRPVQAEGETVIDIAEIPAGPKPLPQP